MQRKGAEKLKTRCRELEKDAEKLREVRNTEKKNTGV
jgi:hypothetical protein